MNPLLILALAAGLLIPASVRAQTSPPSQEASKPRVIIIDRSQSGTPPAPPERPINRPRTYQEISPPMQGPTPLSPMLPRVGN